MRALALLFLCSGVMLMGMAAHAGQRVLALTNWVDREWPRTLLHYDLTFGAKEFRPGKVALLDSAAQPMPCQVAVRETFRDGSIKRCRVSFYAALKKAERATYTLVSMDTPPDVGADVAAALKDGALEVTTAALGVRVPAPGKRSFTTPVEASTVPAPLLGYRLSDGTWAGKGWLESERKVTGWSQTVVTDGPLYKEYAYEVRFAPTGYYRARVTVEAELAAARVAEEYDMGAALPGDNFFVLALNQGWQPDTALWTGWIKPADATEEQARGGRGDDVGLFTQALDFSKGREHNALYPWRDYGTKAEWYGLFGKAAAATAPFVGIITQHVGAWRLPDSSLSPIVWTKDGQVLAKMRLAVNTQGTPMNLFSTAQLDPDLPQTCGRRMWLLALGARPMPGKDGKLDVGRFDAYRNYDGFINLDDYKDWILSWPAQPLSHPRVFITTEQLTALRANLDRCPGKERIKNFYLVSGDPKTAQAEADRAIRLLDDRFRTFSGNYNPMFRQIQCDYEPIFYADSALSWPDLPVEQREKILAKAAACWYMTMYPDYYPRGAGVHLGNPNMTINRSMGFPLYATLLQDHPRAKAVLDEMADFTKWLTGYNITPAGGVFRDGTHYSTYGPSVFISSAAIALRNAGYDLDQWPPIKELGQYFVDLESPPTIIRHRQMPEEYRKQQIRVLPSFGNGRDVTAAQTELQLANLTAKSDPAYAAGMLSAWQQAGSYLGTGDGPLPDFFWFYWPATVTPRAPAREDRMITGFGGVLRAHAGTPDELYAALRMGYVQSHWASGQGSDQGTFVLYARGACLSPGTGWGYSTVPEGFCHDSLVTFGTALADHPFGFVDNNIVDYGFLPSASYLLGRQPFKKRLDKTGTYPGDFDWSRQVLLLRASRPDGPNYVVARDTTQGTAPRSWWYQWLLAKGEDVTPIPGGVHVDAAQNGVKLDITFLEPANAQVTIKGTKVPDFTEDYTQISLSQPANAGYLAVFAPYKAGETPPKVERVAEGLLKVTTTESTDYVFCAADRPVAYHDDDLDITACAGAVRVFPDHVLLINASGRLGSVGYKGAIAQGIGPFEQRVAANPARQFLQIGAKSTSAVPPGFGKVIMVDGINPPADPEARSSGLTGSIGLDGEKTVFTVTAGIGVIRYQDFYVRGEAPFICVHQPGKVTLTTEGRRRIFEMPIPTDIVPANYLPPYASLPDDFKREWVNWPWAVAAKIDGVSRQDGWYDGVMSVGVPEGKHVVEFGPYTNPPVWKENAFTRLLEVGGK